MGKNGFIKRTIEKEKAFVEKAKQRKEQRFQAKERKIERELERQEKLSKIQRLRTARRNKLFQEKARIRQLKSERFKAKTAGLRKFGASSVKIARSFKKPTRSRTKKRKSRSTSVWDL